MSDNPPVSSGDMPEPSSPIFLAMRDIARAATPDGIVAALRQHILAEMDRISLVLVEPGVIGEPVGRVVAAWDRDGLATERELPTNVLEVIGEQPLVVVDTIYLDESLIPLKVYAVDWLKASSFGVFPLQAAGQTLGYLIVAARKTHLQNDQEARALLMLGWQIAAVLHSHKQAETLAAQTQRASLIADLSQGIASCLTYDALGETLTQRLGKLFPLAYLSVTLRQSDTSETRMINWYHAELANHIQLNTALIHQVIITGETAFLDGLSWSADGGEANQGIQKLLIIPLGSAAERVGTLNIGLGPGTFFGADERRLCESVARQVGAALNNVRTVELLTHSLEETTTLYSTTLALAASQSADEIYETALSEVARFCPASRITLYLTGPDAREAVEYVEPVAVWKNGRLLTPSAMRYPINEAPVLAQFPQSRSNLIFNDIRSDERLSDDLRRYYSDEGVGALMMIPVSTGAVWLGALLIEASKGEQFTEDQSRLCRSLADQTSTALDAQFLVTRTRQAVARERAVRDITDHIRRASTADEIRAITTGEVSRILGIESDKLADLSMVDGARLGLSRAEREFVENAAAQASLAIENLRLLQSERQAMHVEQTLSNVTVQLQHAGEMAEVMETAARTLQSALGDYDIRIRLNMPQRSQHRLTTGPLTSEAVEQHLEAAEPQPEAVEPQPQAVEPQPQAVEPQPEDRKKKKRSHKTSTGTKRLG